MGTQHDGERKLGIPFRLEKAAEQVDLEVVIFQQEFELTEPGVVDLSFPVTVSGKVRATLEYWPDPVPDYLPGDDSDARSEPEPGDNAGYHGFEQ